METHMGMFEAKTHFSSLVENVEQGNEIVITRRGKPVAKLMPYGEPNQEGRRKRVGEAIEGLRNLRRRVEKRRIRLGLPPLTQKDIKAMIEKGRR